jgi:hypothetical protein
MAVTDKDLLQFVAELREHAARGTPVTWNAWPWTDVDSRLLHHLPPPTSSSAADVSGDWRASFRFGLLHYRRGPGFVLVSDSRPGTSATDILLDRPQELSLLERLSQPGILAPDEDGAETLRAYGLVLERDGMGVALPYRRRRLPLPLSVLN